MTPNRYTEVSHQAGVRYQTVLSTFRGMLFAFLAQPFSIRMAADLRRNAVEVGRMFIRSEEPLIEEALEESARSAVETAQRDLGLTVRAEISSAQSAFLAQHNDYLLSEVQAQLSRDVEMLVRRYREFGLEAHLNQTAGEGLIAPRVTTDRTRFYFRDRVGRLYPSQKFIRSVWRHSLVTIGAEFYCMEAVSAGAQEVEVVHPDVGSRFNGLRIGLTERSSAPAFIDVRDEVFHPQSQAVLKVTDVHSE